MSIYEGKINAMIKKLIQKQLKKNLILLLDPTMNQPVRVRRMVTLGIQMLTKFLNRPG